MIARSVGSVARLSQAAGQASLRAATATSVASTSYRSAFRRDASSSSLSGPFTPSLARAAKKKSAAARGSTSMQELEELNEEQENEEEDDDLFAISSPDDKGLSHNLPPLTRAKREQDSPGRPTFAENKESLYGKMQQIDVDGSHTQGLRKSDWSLMVRSAESLEDIQQCLELASDWKTLVYRSGNRLPSFSVKQSRVLLIRCYELGIPEFALRALMQRSKTGLDYDNRLLRQVQMLLAKKLIGSKWTEEKLAMTKQALSADVFPSSAVEAEQAGEAVGSATTSNDAEGAATESESHVAEAFVVKSSLADQMLVLAAASSLFTPDKSSVDPVALLLSIGAMIKAFHLGQAAASTPEGEDATNSQIHDRVGRALRVFCSQPEITTLAVTPDEAPWLKIAREATEQFVESSTFQGEADFLSKRELAERLQTIKQNEDDIMQRVKKEQPKEKPIDDSAVSSGSPATDNASTI